MSAEPTESEIEASVSLSLQVPGLGTSRCASACRRHKKPVHVHDGSELLDQRVSRVRIISLIREFSENEQQFQGILEIAKITFSNREYLTVAQVEKVVQVFHRVLMKPGFPKFE